MLSRSEALRELRLRVSSEYPEAERVREIGSAGDETLYGLDLPAGEAVSAQERLREQCADVAFWPVAVSPSDAFRLDSSPRECLVSAWPAAALSAVRFFDLDDWLQDRRAQLAEDDPMRGCWIERSFGDIEVELPDNNYAAELHLIALVPCRSPAEVGAFLPDCTANNSKDVLHPLVHVALFKRWARRWGAELACYACNQLEFRVTEPPWQRVDALALAWEHFAYCSDVLGEGSTLQARASSSFDDWHLEDLASALIGAPVWRFWWD